MEKTKHLRKILCTAQKRQSDTDENGLLTFSISTDTIHFSKTKYLSSVAKNTWKRHQKSESSRFFLLIRYASYKFLYQKHYLFYETDSNSVELSSRANFCSHRHHLQDFNKFEHRNAQWRGFSLIFIFCRKILINGE